MKLRKIQIGLVFIVSILVITSLPISAQTIIEDEFQNPPNSAKPHTWWHWVDGHVSKEGITKDMETWKEVGIGGFQQFDISWGIPYGGTEFNSPEYHDKMVHAFNETERLGLDTFESVIQ